jgi:Ca2+-binding RTX toxin-like protein
LLGGYGNDTVIGAALDADGQDQSGQNFLNGGAGDDVLVAGNGDYMNGGSGADQFTLGGWLQSAATIVDYQPGDDRIVLQYDPARLPEPDLSIAFAPDDLATAQIWLNGQMIAQVVNAPGLSVTDIGLVPQTGLGLARA